MSHPNAKTQPARATLTGDTDAESACEVAENEVKERVGEHLDRIDNSVSTQLEDLNGDEPADD